MIPNEVAYPAYVSLFLTVVSKEGRNLVIYYAKQNAKEKKLSHSSSKSLLSLTLLQYNVCIMFSQHCEASV